LSRINYILLQIFQKVKCLLLFFKNREINKSYIVNIKNGKDNPLVKYAKTQQKQQTTQKQYIAIG